MFDEDFELPKLKTDETNESSYNSNEINLDATPSLDAVESLENINKTNDSEINLSASFDSSNIESPTIELPTLNQDNSDDEDSNPLNLPEIKSAPEDNILDLPAKAEDTLTIPEAPSFDNADLLTETAFGSTIDSEKKQSTETPITETTNPVISSAFDNNLNINQIIPSEIPIEQQSETIPTFDNIPNLEASPEPIILDAQINNSTNENPVIIEELTPNLEKTLEIPVQEQPVDLSPTEIIPLEPILTDPSLEKTLEIPVQETPIETFPSEPIILDTNINPQIGNTPVIETTPPAPIETLDIQTEAIPTWETPTLGNTPVNETVVYDTPDTSIQFQVDGTLASTVNNEIPSFEQSLAPFEEYIEEPVNKKDPIIIVSTLLIIASLIMAAAYFFMTQGGELPFGTKTTTTTTTTTVTTTANTDKTWPVAGRYAESDTKVCPDKAVELTLNEDNTFTFKDLTYDTQTKQCTELDITGTYQEINGNLTLTTPDNKKINAIRNNLQSHAEIIITGTGNVELTLYRTVHNAS